jgi:thiol-disulfide isomerase/thioredoxin
VQFPRLLEWSVCVRMTTVAIISLAGRLVLAGVLTLSALTKLADRSGTRTALGAFGAPTRLVGPLAILLPLTEFAIAGLLLSSTTAVAGAIAAATLLSVFTVAIARVLARGETPDCHCFGQLHSKPAGPMTLARNGVLITLAAIAIIGSVAEPAPSAVAWIGDLDATQGALLAAAIALVATFAIAGAAVLSLMRSYGRVLVRLDRVEASLAELGFEVGDEPAAPMVGLDPGSDAPWFLTTRLDGRGVSRDDLLTEGRSTLLLFTSPHCGPCAALLPEVARWQAEHADVLRVVLASDGTPDEIRAELDGIDPESVVLDERHELLELFQANGTPGAVLVTADGRVGSWVASGGDEIASLVERATEPEPEPTLPVGAKLPELLLATLDGGTASLASVVDGPTVALFWNPHCGYCQSMRDDLLAWERDTPADAPGLVVISSGDVEDTRADGFTSAVLLDDAFEAGNAFGANGTPMGVLLAADGTIATQVVAGADAVLELLRRAAHPTSVERAR